LTKIEHGNASKNWAQIFETYLFYQDTAFALIPDNIRLSFRDSSYGQRLEIETFRTFWRKERWPKTEAKLLNILPVNFIHKNWCFYLFSDMWVKLQNQKTWISQQATIPIFSKNW